MNSLEDQKLALAIASSGTLDNDNPILKVVDSSISSDNSLDHDLKLMGNNAKVDDSSATGQASNPRKLVRQRTGAFGSVFVPNSTRSLMPRPSLTNTGMSTTALSRLTESVKKRYPKDKKMNLSEL